jgi:hypothetical protein
VQLESLSADIDEFWVDTQQDLGRKRNTLFALQILVNTATASFAFVSMVGAIFGVSYYSQRISRAAVLLAFSCSTCGRSV